MNPNITPLPWTIFTERDQSGIEIGPLLPNSVPKYGYVDPVCRIRGEGRSMPAQSKANAAYIVKACNYHDQLVEALKEVDQAVRPGIALWHDQSVMVKVRKLLSTLEESK